MVVNSVRVQGGERMAVNEEGGREGGGELGGRDRMAVN